MMSAIRRFAATRGNFRLASSVVTESLSPTTGRSSERIRTIRISTEPPVTVSLGTDPNGDD